MDDRGSLSPGGAFAIGIACMLCGFPLILTAAGYFGPPKPEDAPAWIKICGGMLFVIAGLGIVLDYGIGYATRGVQSLNYLLGTTLVGLMMAIFGWVAFGRVLACTFLACGALGVRRLVRR